MASPADSSDLYKSQIRDIAGQTSDSPIWRTIPVQNWTTGDVISFDLTPYVISPDGSAVLIAELGDNFPSALSIVSNAVTGTIAEIQGGTYEIVVTATNSTGTPISNILPAIVVELEVTNPIVSALTSYPLQEVGQSFYVDLNDNVTDDGDPINVSAITFTYTTTNGFPVGLDFLPTGIISGTTTTEDTITTVTVTFTNESDLSTTGDFSITVNASAVTSEQPFLTGFFTGPLACTTSVAPTWISGDDFYINLSDTTAKSIDMLGLYLASDGGVAVDLVSIASGSLPDGFTLATTGASIGFITALDGHAQSAVGTYPFTLTARNTDALTSDPSPTFNFIIVDQSAVIPTLLSISAFKDTNDLYLSFSEPVEAVPALDFISGTFLSVNTVNRNLTYVSGDQTAQIRLLADGVAFTENNTLTVIIVGLSTNIQSVATGNLVSDENISITLLPVPVGDSIISANFDSGALGTVANGVSGIDGALSQTVYSNEQSVSGLQSAKATITALTDGFGDFGFNNMTLSPNLVQGQSLWFRAKVRTLSPWNNWSVGGSTPEGPKGIRFRVERSDGSGEGYWNFNPSDAGMLVASSVIPNWITDYHGWPDYDSRELTPQLPDDTWMTWEFMVKFHSIPGQGIIRAWYDGDLIFEDIVSPTMQQSTDKVVTMQMFTYWRGDPYWPATTQSCYIDDVEVTTVTPSGRDLFNNPYIGV